MGVFVRHFVTEGLGNLPDFRVFGGNSRVANPGLHTEVIAGWHNLFGWSLVDTVSFHSQGNP